MAGISIINTDPNAAPVREGRMTTGSITTLNGEVVLPVNGDQSAIVQVNGFSPVLTVVFEGSIDGVNYFPVPTLAGYGVGGTLPHAGRRIALELYAATVALRIYQVRCAGLRYVRVRASTFTSGGIDVTISADTNDCLLRNLDGLAPTSDIVTATGAAGAAVSVTLTAVPGLRHYITGYEFTRICTAAVGTALATPTLSTAANHGIIISMQNPVQAVGDTLTWSRSFDGGGYAATASGTATTFTLPIQASQMYRGTVYYRLGD